MEHNNFNHGPSIEEANPGFRYLARRYVSVRKNGATHKNDLISKFGKRTLRESNPNRRYSPLDLVQAG